MRIFFASIAIALSVIFGGITGIVNAAPTTTETLCTNKNTFFGLPAWYEYLTVTYKPATNTTPESCSISTSGASAILLIMLAAVDILLRLSALVAIGFVVYGGFIFVTSQGEPGKVASGRKTILNALIGMVIALLASQIVKFVASLLSS